MPNKLPIKQLKDYFKKQPDVVMAFVFGSYAKGRAMPESDIDIAVYFKPQSKRTVEWEEEKDYPNEDKIWLDLERIVKRNVDLAILNRSASTLAFEVLQTGKKLVIKDKMLYWKFFSRVSFEAMDFFEFVENYWAIEQRSHSLNQIDKVRLIELIKFISNELSDYGTYSDISQKSYIQDRIIRRSIERWVENITNCSIDMAKIMLASEKIRLPGTYKETIRLLMVLPKFKQEIAEKLTGFVKLRNLLAHEYLDFRFKEIRKFIDEAMPLYQYLADYVEGILGQKKQENKKTRKQ